MTREDLKEHCEKQMEMCELWAIGRGEEPSGKIYEEHKLILELLEQETCKDCISREDALMCMTGEYVADMTCKPEDIIYKHIQRLRALPPVTPQPKTGLWIKERSLNGWDGCSYQCSVCGRSIHIDTKVETLDDYPYCHCGAKMQEVEECQKKK